jgi:dual specificity protein phosphatase-like protein
VTTSNPARLSIPSGFDASEIGPGLYIGRRPTSDPWPLFDAVVTLTEEPSDCPAPVGKLAMHLPLKDNGHVDDPSTLCAVARFIVGLLQSGRTVFVHCSLGLSRSALFAALVLVERGYSPRDAVDHVRRCRPGSLGAVPGGLWGKSGRAYAAWILEYRPARVAEDGG